MKLILPTATMEEAYSVMIQDWKSTGEQLVPFVLRYDYDDFPALIKQLENEAKGIGFKHAHVMVPHSTYWLVDEENNILGVSNLRHELNDNLRKVGGHIGYGITPSQRRKGYATLILKLSLLEAEKKGIGDVLVTCHKDNVGSAKSITNNGGILEAEFELEGRAMQNYWIRIG
ncbi:MAG: GNAT family N-acetyltransferase [Flavobacteriales bacterium]|nr:GNAT family N-acetyltransferase [Flavobacteriales bacterium]PCH87446.1 MAG: GNAT family N-acetyltransferase [Flavobacteriales bacterium]